MIMSTEATSALPAGTGTHPIAGPGRHFVDVLHRIVAAICAYKQRRASLEILRALDDRTLRDIGIERSELVSALADNARRCASGSGSLPPRN
jgi:uncharacterized protein YjiS (DUF1127 family)